MPKRRLMTMIARPETGAGDDWRESRPSYDRPRFASADIDEEEDPIDDDDEGIA